MAFMDSNERNQLIDMVAQAVIDKIEERDRINNLAELVVERVLSLQEEEATLKKEKPRRRKPTTTDGITDNAKMKSDFVPIEANS